MWIPQNHTKYPCPKEIPIPTLSEGVWESPWMSQSHNKSLVLARQRLKMTPFDLLGFFSPLSVHLSCFKRTSKNVFWEVVFVLSTRMFYHVREMQSCQTPLLGVGDCRDPSPHSTCCTTGQNLPLLGKKNPFLNKNHLKGSPIIGPIAARAEFKHFPRARGKMSFANHQGHVLKRKFRF